ncbi:N-acetylglucosamine kinase [Ferrimonas balearica]|uniref:N-acetylglucosamine kinase n=1 Tax=Ferrimonas balearica TaxID=44012 RepID=UPI0028F727BF|nr:BadF/BadG/BcrA/BcrD ATPase family protein [Ferrimonas balearica]
MSADSPLLLGIDGGGSKCRAILYHPSQGVMGTGLAGAANPVNGLEAAQAAIIEACQQALGAAGLPASKLAECVAGAGLAGVNLPSCYAAMAAWSHPFAQLHLTTDLHIACLGAHGRQDGAIMITGTGSCGFLDLGGNQRIYGGHGFPQGDKGSGAWYGLMAVQKALEASDGQGPHTAMSAGIGRALGSDVALDWVEQLAGQRSTAYARLASVVFEAAEQGDYLALAIRADGTDYINRLARQLLDAGAPRLSLLGGLGPLVIPHLSPEVQDALSPAQATPEMGAVFYAQDQRQQRAQKEQRQ